MMMGLRPYLSAKKPQITDVIHLPTMNADPAHPHPQSNFLF
jgi:hypothetical protein